MKMKLKLLVLVLLFCGLTLAQDTLETQVTQTCSPDVCYFNDFNAMKEKMGVMETRLMNSENQIQELKNKLSTKVIFSARTDTSAAIGPFDTDTTLVYGAVITNEGNAYNQNTGIFTAPVNGTYYFTFFYHAGGEHKVNLFLMKNRHHIVDTTDHQTENDGADNGGNAAFMQLQRGDQVFVFMLANSHVWGQGFANTFSGFLVSQD